MGSTRYVVKPCVGESLTVQASLESQEGLTLIATMNFIPNTGEVVNQDNLAKFYGSSVRRAEKSLH